MGRLDRANPDTENDACRRPSRSQAPATRRPARTAKPQERIPEHEASFQTRGPNRSRQRREHERRIPRSNKKGPGLPGWARLNAPFPALGGRFGVLAFGPAGPPGLRERGEAGGRAGGRFQRAVSPVGAAGLALARSPRDFVRSSARVAHRAPRRTCRLSPAELPRRLYLRSDRSPSMVGSRRANCATDAPAICRLR